MGMAPLGGGDDDLVPIADINITPFVDVMLVLLIIFMVAAPLMSATVPVNLPATTAAPDQPEDPVVISIDGAGDIWLGDEKVLAAQLASHLDGIFSTSPDRVIYLRGDRDVAYGHLMAVMEALRKAGFVKVSLATEPTES